MALRLIGVGLSAIAMAIGTPLARGGDDTLDAVKSAKVKAAYLLNFAKFVTWPSEAFGSDNAPLVIGVLGSDPFGAILDETLRDKAIGDHPLVARRLTLGGEEAVAELRRCHVLYVAESERPRVAQVLQLLENAQVLIVGEGEDFAAAGGMIGFVLSEGKIAFHINQGAVERNGLRVSSKLLQLAKVVHSEKK